MARERLARHFPVLAGGFVVALGLAACDSSTGSSGGNVSGPGTPGPDGVVEGTVVRFTAGSTLVEAVIEEDSPTTRSFLAMLPMTLQFSDFGGQEKVSSPPDAFDYSGAEGMEPEAGDLFSYRPWGNLGFFYDAEGSTYSEDLVRIGTTDDIDQIEQLDGQDVTIALAP